MRSTGFFVQAPRIPPAGCHSSAKFHLRRRTFRRRIYCRQDQDYKTPGPARETQSPFGALPMCRHCVRLAFCAALALSGCRGPAPAPPTDVEFTYLWPDGSPLSTIVALSPQLVDDAIAAANIDKTDPMVDYFAHPVHMALKLPPRLDPGTRDTIDAIVTCRATGETLRLKLVESSKTSLKFQDRAKEFHAEIGRTKYADDPLKLSSKVCNTLSVEVGSLKFGKRFDDFVFFHETKPGSRVFKDESISGTVTLSRGKSPGRTAVFSGRRGKLAWDNIKLTEKAGDVFSNADLTLKFVPSNESVLSSDLSAEHAEQLKCVLTWPARRINGELMFLVETGKDSLSFVAKVPEDVVAYRTRLSGRPSPPTTPTLERLDKMAAERAFRIRVTGLPKRSTKYEVRVSGLDRNDAVVHSVLVTLVEQGPGVYLTDKPVLSADGKMTAAFKKRYGATYYLLETPWGTTVCLK